MRRYDIFKLDGEELTYVKRFANRNKADEFLAYKTESSAFYVMYYYVDYSKREGTERWTFMSSILFLNGIPAMHSRKRLDVQDIEKLKQKLGRVYTADGKMYYINNRQLTNQDVFDMIGGWGHVKVVQDKPDRMAIIYRDVDYILQGKIKEPLPPLNKQASEKFGLTLYGNVIYINENYC